MRIWLGLPGFLLLLGPLQADQRVEILRLLLSEGPRFPALTEIYYRVVVEPNISKLQALLKRSVKPEAAALADFPQLLGAPVLTGLIWNTLFERFREIDLEKMMRVHFQLISVWLKDELDDTR